MKTYYEIRKLNTPDDPANSEWIVIQDGDQPDDPVEFDTLAEAKEAVQRYIEDECNSPEDAQKIADTLRIAQIQTAYIMLTVDAKGKVMGRDYVDNRH